jgi:hypothetical protein
MHKIMTITHLVFGLPSVALLLGALNLSLEVFCLDIDLPQPIKTAMTHTRESAVTKRQ